MCTEIKEKERIQTENKKDWGSARALMNVLVSQNTEKTLDGRLCGDKKKKKKLKLKKRINYNILYNIIENRKKSF